jgi:hypothetical protein
LPNLLTGPELILPQPQMGWLLQQPDDVLDQNEVNRDFLQADYTMLHPKVIFDSVHGEVIKSELTRRLGEFTEGINEEIDLAFRITCGVDTKEWKEIVVYDVMSEIITRISNRVLVGLPLCKFPVTIASYFTDIFKAVMKTTSTIPQDLIAGLCSCLLL